MAEVYTADNELLNIGTDEETGVEYIPTGLSPYYVEFRRLVYRFLLAAKRANDLRVYDEGGLEIGVKAGRYFVANELVEFEESNGNALADNKDEIYIYIDSDNQLVTDEYDAFPSMAEEPHIRLAVVTTSGGDIVSIDDHRGGCSYIVPFGAGGSKRDFIEHSADATLENYQSGSIHSNGQATETVTITLPSSPNAGEVFSFAVQVNQQLRIDPGTAAIIDSSGQTADKYKYADAIGACMIVVSDSSGNWATISKSGSWSEQA